MNFLKCLNTCFSFDTKNKIKSIAAKRRHAKKESLHQHMPIKHKQEKINAMKTECLRISPIVNRTNISAEKLTL